MKTAASNSMRKATTISALGAIAILLWDVGAIFASHCYRVYQTTCCEHIVTGTYCTQPGPSGQEVWCEGNWVTSQIVNSLEGGHTTGWGVNDFTRGSDKMCVWEEVICVAQQDPCGPFDTENPITDWCPHYIEPATETCSD